MSSEPICPCEGFVHPRSLYNPPGLDRIQYRLGDFASFRRALLMPLLDDKGQIAERDLLNWRPASNSDLTLQLVEWWAYLADILTFYDERIAHETYLRTAIQPESVQRLIRLLGYRPRPGIGARGWVAAMLATGAKSTHLPQGLGLQSKPSPGKQPQIFEFKRSATLGLPDALSVNLQPPAPPKWVFSILAAGANVNLLPKAGVQIHPVSLQLLPSPALDPSVLKTLSGAIASDSPDPGNPVSALLSIPGLEDRFSLAGPSIDSLLLKGEISGLNSGDRMLLVEKAWNGGSHHYRWLKVSDTAVEKDPRGNANTRVHIQKIEVWAGFDERFTRLLKPTQTAHLWPYLATSQAIVGSEAHLDRLVKQISVGDMLLFERSLQVYSLFKVAGYREDRWNVDSPDPNIPLLLIAPILHSVLGLIPHPDPHWNDNTGNITLHYSWRDVGQLISTPPTTFENHDLDGGSVSFVAVRPDGSVISNGAFPPDLSSVKIFIEDVEGQGLLADATTDATGATLTASGFPVQPFLLKHPLKILFNLLPVSRGKTVTNEVLGSGDAGSAGQEFVLKNAPLTYFMSGDSSSGDDYKSTLRVWADGIEWQEVSSFFGRGPRDRIFVTREDENNQTHVLFGDGINGSRLPSGLNNIIANYRFGSGAEAPEAGKLTVIMQPQPGLKTIRNPVAVGGGDDPDPPSKIRKYAPRSVLAFGRAVSADDYEVIASQAPGVRRAKSVWSFDAANQRAMPVIYVGDDVSAVESASQTLNLAADPNRSFSVKLAIKKPISLKLILEIAANYATQPVLDAVRRLLTDLDTGLFGDGNVGIGQVFFRSEIDAACLKAPGVVAVHQVGLWSSSGRRFSLIRGSKYDPGADGFFYLEPERLFILTETVNP